MKNMFVASVGFLLMVITGMKSQAFQVTYYSMNAPLENMQLNPGQVAYGYSKALFRWDEWLKRDRSEPLLVKTDYDKTDIDVFEARAAALIDRHPKTFDKKYLLNIETIKQLSPSDNVNSMTATNYQSLFMVKTVIPFPVLWQTVIAGRNASIETEAAAHFKTADKNLIKDLDLKIWSKFLFYEDSQIQANQDNTQIKIQQLDTSHLNPVAINFQYSIKVNQIADFISVITVFYDINVDRNPEHDKTLVVSYVAAAMKRHDLNKKPIMGVTPRNILMGEVDSKLKYSSGIGAGLPNYFLEVFTSMISGFEKYQSKN